MDTERLFTVDETTSYGNGILEFDIPKLSIVMEPNSVHEGIFHIQSNVGKRVNGRIFVRDFRLHISEEPLHGKDFCVPYEYHSNGLECGDKQQGEIIVATDLGEFYLPYEVSIETTTLSSSIGEINNLFHFANLAKMDWKQAVKCFSHPLFVNLLTGSGKQFEEDYYILLNHAKESNSFDEALEQFLVLIRKKGPATIKSLNEKIKLSKEDLEETIPIEFLHEGWGYKKTGLRVLGPDKKPMADCPLKLNKNQIHTYDFHKNQYVLEIGVRKDLLKDGINTLLLCDDEDEVLSTIVISVENGSSAHRFVVKRSEGVLKANITRLYLAYRTGSLSLDEIIEETEDLLEKIRDVDEIMVLLYKAHLRLLMGQNNEAIWILKNGKRLLESRPVKTEVYGYFLYLLSTADNELQRKSSELLENYALEEPESFHLYWCMMHKESLQVKNPISVYRRMTNFYHDGCNNPLMYLETAILLLEDSSVMKSLDEFELQVLLFMDRYGLVNKDIVDHVYDIPVNLAEMKNSLLYFCKKYACDDEAKQARMLCHLYMKQDSKAKEKVYWLKQGILYDCRINGLYEAYIRALNFNEREVLPKQVVMYLAYENSLEANYLAYAYAQILRQRENLSEEFEEKIKRFVLNQLENKKINKSLGYLYRNVLSGDDLTEEQKDFLIETSFVHELLLDERVNANMVIVRHRGLCKEERYIIKNHKAKIKLYTLDYEIAFLDKNDKCKKLEDSYSLIPFSDYQKISNKVGKRKAHSTGELFYLINKEPLSSIERADDFTERFEEYERLLLSDEIQNEFRRDLASELLKGYAKWDFCEGVKDAVCRLNPELLSGKERADQIRLLCIFDEYELAYANLRRFGFEQVDVRFLLRISQYGLLEKNKIDSYDKFLLEVIYYSFKRGKYTEEMLAYLCKYFNGSSKQMRDVYNVAKDYHVDTIELGARILEHIVFSGSFISNREQIFMDYVNSCGKEEIIKVYLVNRAEGYFVNGEFVEDELFQVLNRRLLMEYDYPFVTHLAILKYHSEHADSLSDKEKEMCVSFLGESLGKDIYFPFFSAYEAIYPVLEIYSENTYIEYRCEPGSNVTINYFIDRPDRDSGFYHTEAMDEIYPGIYQKAFHLYWGDQAQYYVTLLIDEEEQFVLNGTIERTEATEGSNHGCFRLINDISLAMELKDFRTVDELTKEYAKKSYFTKQLLSIKTNKGR